MKLRELAIRWRARAGELNEYAPGVSAAFRRCAEDLDRELRNQSREEQGKLPPKRRGRQSLESYTREMIRANQKG